MSHYEMMVIFKPQVAAEEVRKPLEVMEALVAQHKGKIEAVDDWGEKALSFVIKGHERGYYVVYQLAMERDQVARFTAKMNLDKEILRFLLVTKV